MQRHETDAVALTFALIFLGIATGWLLVAADAADVTGLRWFFPALLLGAGGAGLLASLLKRPGRTHDLGPAPAAEEVVDTPGGQS